jgi:hypothetical protein
MDKEDFLDIVYDALEVEGEKQEKVMEVSRSNGYVYFSAADGKEWQISIRQISRKGKPGT